MISLGIDLQKGFVRYSILAGTKNNPKLTKKDRIAIPSIPNTKNLLNWFESYFQSLLNKENPNTVSYRVSENPSRKQFPYLIYPYAILNLLCFRGNLQIHEYITRNITPKKLSFQPSEDKYVICDKVFGKNPPYWDISQKNSILVAWLSLT